MGTFYVVYPSAQWRRDYPHLVPCFVWVSMKFAMESRDDCDGFMVKVRLQEKVR